MHGSMNIKLYFKLLPYQEVNLNIQRQEKPQISPNFFVEERKLIAPSSLLEDLLLIN
jgi:hypothetical protein